MENSLVALQKVKSPYNQHTYWVLPNIWATREAQTLHKRVEIKTVQCLEQRSLEKLL